MPKEQKANRRNLFLGCSAYLAYFKQDVLASSKGDVIAMPRTGLLLHLAPHFLHPLRFLFLQKILLLATKLKIQIRK